MAELNKAKISQRLRTARDAAGLTQQQMAELMHLHKRSIEDYESPKKATVPFDRINEWAKLTQTTPEFLLHGVEAVTGGAAENGDLAEVLSRLEELGDALANLEKGQAALLRRLPAQRAARPKPAAAATKRRR